MIIIAILIKAYDRGPVFYKQRRLMENNRIFLRAEVPKYAVDSEVRGSKAGHEKDSRVTPIGRC